MSYKSCGNCADRKCTEIMRSEGLDTTTSCDDSWQPIHCPLCGGTLSEIRTNGQYPVRHCYACHFEFFLEGEK